jgi:hypothetical protein
VGLRWPERHIFRDTEVPPTFPTNKNARRFAALKRYIVKTLKRQKLPSRERHPL